MKSSSLSHLLCHYNGVSPVVKLPQAKVTQKEKKSWITITYLYIWRERWGNSYFLWNPRSHKSSEIGKSLSLSVNERFCHLHYTTGTILNRRHWFQEIDRYTTLLIFVSFIFTNQRFPGRGRKFHLTIFMVSWHSHFWQSCITQILVPQQLEVYSALYTHCGGLPYLPMHHTKPTYVTGIREIHSISTNLHKQHKWPNQTRKSNGVLFPVPPIL